MLHPGLGGGATKQTIVRNYTKPRYKLGLVLAKGSDPPRRMVGERPRGFIVDASDRM